MKPTATLSGGETARLLLAKLMLFKDNVLVLDEPTNHLDLESIAALSEALQKFEGTVIVVTHDQELIREVGSRVWAMHQRRAGASTSRARSTSSWRSTPTSRACTRRTSSEHASVGRPSPSENPPEHVGPVRHDPVHPEREQRRISASSSTVQTWTGMPRAWKYATTGASTTVRSPIRCGRSARS